MSARKAVGGSPTPVRLQARETTLYLNRDAVFLSPNGIEFRSSAPFAPWNEMTLTIQSSIDGTEVQCSGVVVDCNGNRHSGYRISMVFTGVTRQAQSRLEAMAMQQLW